MYKRTPQGWMKHLDFIVLDLMCLHLAFLLSYMIRHGLKNPYGDGSYLSVLIFFTMASILTAVFFHTFKNVLKRGYYQDFVAGLKHMCLVILLVTFYLFTIKDRPGISRIVIYLTGINYLAFGYISRLLWKKYLRKKLKGKNRKSLLIVTTGSRISEIIVHIRENSFDIFHIAGAVSVDGERPQGISDEISVYTDGEKAVEAVCAQWVDEALFVLPVGAAYPRRLVRQLMEMGVVVHMGLDGIAEHMGGKQFVEKISDYTVLTTSINTASMGQAAFKRLFDIAAGLVGCTVTLLLLPIIGTMIYVSSPGPVFFKQTRVGKGGKRFQMYKFRSMYMDAEERKKELLQQNRITDGKMFKLDYDPRIIGSGKLSDGTVKKGIGNFIRDYSLDEFPQFFNVLKGDMSLVGTRPPTVDEWEKYDLHHRARLAVKPGITGLWQVSGRSNITDFEEVVKLDLQYITEWTFGLDVKIALKTVGVVLGKRGAM